MQSLLRACFTGLFISFLGSLPLGSLNIAAMQIAISSGVIQALYFSIGSLSAEVVYVRLSLVAMDWIRKQQKILKALEWVVLYCSGFSYCFLLCCSSPQHKRKPHFNQFPASFFTGTYDECSQPGTNTILVWMEYRFIYQKNTVARKQPL